MSSPLPPQFRVVLQDESLAPRLAPGDELVFTRADVPVVGRIALIRHSTGAHLARWIREKLPGQFIAYSTNPGFVDLDLRTDDMAVVGVCTEILIKDPTIQKF